MLRLIYAGAHRFFNVFRKSLPPPALQRPPVCTVRNLAFEDETFRVMEIMDHHCGFVVYRFLHVQKLGTVIHYLDATQDF